MPFAISAETLPLGPSTRTVLPSTLYFTPAGRGITFFPIRDIDSCPSHLACESRKAVISDQLTVISSTPYRSTAAGKAVHSSQFVVHSLKLMCNDDALQTTNCELRTVFTTLRKATRRPRLR